MSFWKWVSGKGKRSGQVAPAKRPSHESTPTSSQESAALKAAGPVPTSASPMDRISRPIVALLQSPEAARRQDGVDELRKVGGPEVRVVLSDILFGDSDDFVRQSALHALAEMYGPDVSPMLIKVLRYDSGRRVRVSATNFLGKWKMTDALLEALRDPGHTVRETAIEYLGDAGVLSPVLQMLSDTEGEVRQVAAETLGRHGDRNAVPALERLSTDQDDYVRNAAKNAVEAIRKRAT